MRLRVVTTRQGGIARPPREVTRAAGVVGELLVCERLDPLLRRTTRVATLTMIGDAKTRELLPPLYDAVLLWVSPQGFVLAGTERVDHGADGRQIELGQAWWARPD
jgi:hypothetical protein